jgi:osmoprotectant transport system ATP-binding protein
MTVEENISIVPKLLKWEEKKIKKRVFELLELVGFDPKEIMNRFPTQLSGGQRQRIGVARALAQDPPIILMDEPFGALDPITREQIQKDFIELESSIQKTVIFVTHDVSEAIRMGDRIALLDKGKIMQIGSPSDLLENPSNDFVLNFFSQHWFQLILQTKQIKEFFALPLEEEKEQIEPIFPYLSDKHTFFEALDIFNETKKSILPVFKKRKFIGKLQKTSLLKAIIEILQEKTK